MIGRIKRRIRQTFPLVDKHLFSRSSFSQEGEDLILLRFFKEKRRGFYVDVGAHHPYRFSNTQIFYDMGWQGINIDALPGSMELFRRRRPHDINLEIGIGEESATAQFHVFNEPAVNTFDPVLAKERNQLPWRIERVIDVPVLPLREVLAQHVSDGAIIDFLTVDVEGYDLAVLRSNDWVRYRPRLVLAESVGRDLSSIADEAIAVFLSQQGYRPYAKTVNTFFFIDRSIPAGA